MKPTMFVAILILGIGAGLAAQSGPEPDRKTIMLTGYVERLASSRDTSATKFVLTRPELLTPEVAGTAGTAEGYATDAPVYLLQGDDNVFAKLVGRKVTITGSVPVKWHRFDAATSSTHAPKLIVAKIEANHAPRN
jgi:hypothetical protein